MELTAGVRTGAQGQQAVVGVELLPFGFQSIEVYVIGIECDGYLMSGEHNPTVGMPRLRTCIYIGNIYIKETRCLDTLEPSIC